MTLIITSFIAGALTVAAPCVLPLLPVIVAGSVAEEDKKRPFIIIASLSVSVIVFTLLLKVSTLFIEVSPSFWAKISGALVLFFGIITLFPALWDKFETLIGLGSSTNTFLQKSTQKSGVWGSVLIGAALGPVFSSCSPTYALIIATILPQSFLVGFVNVIVYVLGLSIMLLLISIFGQKLVAKMKWLADPHGAFKKVLGVIFIVVGISVMFGIDKEVETWLILQGIYKVPSLELELLNKM